MNFTSFYHIICFHWFELPEGVVNGSKPPKAYAADLHRSSVCRFLAACDFFWSLCRGENGGIPKSPSHWWSFPEFSLLKCSNDRMIWGYHHFRKRQVLSLSNKHKIMDFPSVFMVLFLGDDNDDLKTGTPPDQMVDDCPYWPKIEKVMGKRRISGWCWLEPWNGLWLSKYIGNGKSSQLDELIFFRGTETTNQTTWVGFNVCFFGICFQSLP